MEDCTTCTHCKLDPVWGEYKCLQHARYIREIKSKDECPEYKAKKEVRQ